MSVTLNSINKAIASDPKQFVLECEENFRVQTAAAAKKVCEKSGNRLILLAGPSSSGKTTTASIIAAEAEKNGRNTKVISLDDFYRDQTETIYFEDGTPDYETIDAIDAEYVRQCLEGLISDGTCMLPRFSFVTKQREKVLYELRIDKDDIIVVEGLHAINPRISEGIETDKLTKIYVSVSSRVMEGAQVLLSKRELRFIRRLIRDYHHRQSQVDNTFYLWNGVKKGEDRYIFPFSHLADTKIDSIHPYEPCIFKEEAIKLLDHIDSDSVYCNTALLLREKLMRFESLERSYVPQDSLLCEFIG